MARIALQMATTAPATATPKSKGKGKGDPTMPRADLKALTARLVAVESLKEATAILRRFVKERGLETGPGTWGHYMLRLARGLARRKAVFAVFAEGNSKLPFWQFSALPAFTCPGAGECLDWCYSFTGWRYPAPWARQVQNTLYLRFAPEVIEQAWKALPMAVQVKVAVKVRRVKSRRTGKRRNVKVPVYQDRPTVVRLYVDGDFDSLATIGFWMRLIAARPELQVYGYSKSWALLWEYAQTNRVPSNYVLNLSSGGREQGVTAEQMAALPFVRGRFVAVVLPEGYKGPRGNKRYDDNEYHRAVRKAAREAGLGKVFSCPGDCGKCCGGRHACGQLGVELPVAIGIH